MAARRRDRLRRVPTPVAAKRRSYGKRGRRARPTCATCAANIARGAVGICAECRCPLRSRPSVAPTENEGAVRPTLHDMCGQHRAGCGRHLCRNADAHPVAAKRRAYGKRGRRARPTLHDMCGQHRAGCGRHLCRNADAHPVAAKRRAYGKRGRRARPTLHDMCGQHRAGCGRHLCRNPEPIPAAAKRRSYGHPRAPVGAASAAKAAALHCPSALLDAFPRRRGFSRESAALRCAVLPARSRQPAPGRASHALPGLRHALTPRRLCVEPGR